MKRIWITILLIALMGCRTAQKKQKQEVSDLETAKRFLWYESTTGLDDQPFDKSFCQEATSLNLNNSLWLSAMSSNEYAHFGILAPWLEKVGFGNKGEGEFWNLKWYQLDYVKQLERVLKINSAAEIYKELDGRRYIDLTRVQIKDADHYLALDLTFRNKLLNHGILSETKLEKGLDPKLTSLWSKVLSVFSDSSNSSPIAVISRSITRKLLDDSQVESMVRIISNLGIEEDKWKSKEKLSEWLKEVNQSFLRLVQSLEIESGSLTAFFTQLNEEYEMDRMEHFAAILDAFDGERRQLLQRQKEGNISLTYMDARLALMKKEWGVTLGSDFKTYVLSEYRKNQYLIKNSDTFERNISVVPLKDKKLQFFSTFSLGGSTGSTQLFYAQHRTLPLAIASFRGTEFFEVVDWATNIHASREELDMSRREEWGVVHKGFHDALLSLRDLSLVIKVKALEKVEDENGVKQPVGLWLTGHSLGGALATISGSYLINAAKELKDPDWKLKGIYTYGAPRVGDSDYRAKFERETKQAKIPFYRFVNKNDLVPSIPGRIFNEIEEGEDIGKHRYEHVGHLVYFSQVTRQKNQLFHRQECIDNSQSGYHVRRPNSVPDHAITNYTKAIENNYDAFKKKKDQFDLSSYLECDEKKSAISFYQEFREDVTTKVPEGCHFYQINKR